MTQLGSKLIGGPNCRPEDDKKIKIKSIIYRYLSWYLLTQILSLDPQGSMLVGEPDPWVQVHAGIPMGIPTGNLYGPAPMSSLNCILT